MDKVNVLYCFDSKSWRSAAVSIESLLLNANPTTRITVHCMVTPGTRGKRKINRIIKSHEIGATLVWREVKKCENPFGGEEYAKWGPVPFYRCVAYRFFKDVDKMLYLGNNTLVYHDLLYGLYDTDISDYAFAAVPDMAPIKDLTSTVAAPVRAFSEKYLNNGPYYNSGVLLMNLKKMAESERAYFEKRIPLNYPEQDLLNVTFAGKIKTLPLKYNLAPGAGIPAHFSKEEADEINAGGHIILDCYYTKAYDKEHSNKIAYDMFAKCAKNIGMKPSKFVAADNKLIPVKKTYVPFVKVRGKTILFFGMEIK